VLRREWLFIIVVEIFSLRHALGFPFSDQRSRPEFGKYKKRSGLQDTVGKNGLMFSDTFRLFFCKQHCDGNSFLVGYIVFKKLPDFVKRIVLPYYRKPHFCDRSCH
jgi:hypothetical protein